MSLRFRILFELEQHGTMTVRDLIVTLAYPGAQQALSKKLDILCAQGYIEKGQKVPRQREDKLGPPLVNTWLRTGKPITSRPAARAEHIGKGELQRVVVARAADPLPSIVPQALAVRTELERCWGAGA